MHEHSFIPLLVVVAAAMVTGIVLPRIKFLRVPVVVGEILAGIALGKSGFHIIPDEPDPWLELLSLFGFAFLMFLSGLEIDLRSLHVDTGRGGEDSKKALRKLLLVTFGIFFATLVTSLALSEVLVLFGYLESPYIMALIMSTTSVGLVMPLLKERGEADSNFGQILILSAVVADFTTMLLITVVVAFYDQAGLTLDVLVIGTLFIVFFVVLWLGRRLLSHESAIVKHLAFAAPKTAELSVRVAMTLMLAFVVFSQIVGAEIILGAFLAGTAISNLSRSSVHGQLGMKLDAIGFGIFIPVFFIMVGARFDVQSLFGDPASLVLVPLLVVFAFVVKVVPSLLLKPFFGKRNAIAAGFLISSRLSLIIAASAIGLRLGVITPEINTAIILVAIITCIASPAIYSSIRGKVEADAAKKTHLDGLLGHVIARPDAEALGLELVEIDAVKFPTLVGKTLAESRLRQETGMTLIAVVQEDGTMVNNPPRDFVIEEPDMLFLVGNEEQIHKMEELATAPG